MSQETPVGPAESRWGWYSSYLRDKTQTCRVRCSKEDEMRTLLAFLYAFLLIFMASSPSATQAQSEVPFYWEFINVDIDVQENGDMLITETQKYVFTGSD